MTSTKGKPASRKGGRVSIEVTRGSNSARRDQDVDLIFRAFRIQGIAKAISKEIQGKESETKDE